MIAKSPHLDENKIIEKSSWITKKERKRTVMIDAKSQTNVVLSEHFLATINQASVVIGLAGTANEQALYLGKPVVCFEGFGPQSTLARFTEQNKLMEGGLVILNDRSPHHVAKHILTTIKKQPAGVTHSTAQNAAEKIIETMLNNNN